MLTRNIRHQGTSDGPSPGHVRRSCIIAVDQRFHPVVWEPHDDHMSPTNVKPRLHHAGHMSPGNMYPGRATCIWIHLSTDTCRRIHVDRSRYMLTISRRHYIHFGHVTVDLYPFVSSNRRATNWQQFCRCNKHVDGNKWIQVATCILL